MQAQTTRPGQAAVQPAPTTARPAPCFGQARNAPQQRRTAAAPRVTGQARLIISALGVMGRPAVAAAATGTPSSSTLLVVGPGVLGSYLGKLWVDEHGTGSVVGQTNTTTSHAK